MNPDVAAADVAPSLLPKFTEGDGSLDVERGGSRSEGRQRGCKSVARSDPPRRDVEVPWPEGSLQRVSFPPEMQTYKCFKVEMHKFKVEMHKCCKVEMQT